MSVSHIRRCGAAEALPPRRVGALAALVVFVTVIGTGCSPSEPERDPSARALFDTKTGRIVMPLDEFDPNGTDQDGELLNHASEIAVGHCMANAGFVYSAAAVTESENRREDETYGPWDVDRALRLGLGNASSPRQAAIDADSAAYGKPWDDAFAVCGSDIPDEVRDFFPSHEETLHSLTGRIGAEAYSHARDDPGWREAREKWWSCLREAGLEPRTGDGEWGSQQTLEITRSRDAGAPSSSFEEEIRLTVIEARCNEETGMARTLADLEASYQAPLIRANQSGLNELKAAREQRLAGARDYIAEQG